MRRLCRLSSFLFFFNDTATTEIYTLSLHDALPIYDPGRGRLRGERARGAGRRDRRSEEHTSELQSRRDLVCRLLLEKKKKESWFVKTLKKIKTLNKDIDTHKQT